jgi:hypothetical protein
LRPFDKAAFAQSLAEGGHPLSARVIKDTNYRQRRLLRAGDERPAATVWTTPTRRIRSGCCARAASGHVATAPPMKRDELAALHLASNDENIAVSAKNYYIQRWRAYLGPHCELSPIPCALTCYRLYIENTGLSPGESRYAAKGFHHAARRRGEPAATILLTAHRIS